LSRARTAAARAFISLRVRNYRLYFVGQLISFTGTWMQSVGQAWLVLKLTGSGLDLGVVTALQFLPILLAGPWGGVVADRVDKRRLIIVTQTVSALLALVLGILTVTGVVTVAMVYGLALGLGMVTLFDMPTRQAFVMEMVGREDIANAVSLNGVLVNASRVLGPAAAGALIATLGIGPCFLINAGSYVAVIVGLFLMRPGELKRDGPAPRRAGQLREGFRYVWHTRELLVPLLLMAVVGALAYNFSIVFPLLVRFEFGRGAGAFGTLFSFLGVGAVLGGLAVAGRNRATRGLLAGSALALGVALGLAALAPSFALEMVLMVPIGAASTAFIATANAILQLGSEPRMRGRVMALFAMVFLGTTPIGGPVVGWVAERFGPRMALGVGATATVLASATVLVVNDLIRRRAGRTQAPIGATKIGSDVGWALPPGGSTLTAKAAKVPRRSAGEATVPSVGTKVPAGRTPVSPVGWNHSS
jgi:MFS family permease